MSNDQIKDALFAWYGSMAATAGVMHADKDSLFSELEDLQKPSFPEFAEAKANARHAVVALLRAGGHVKW